MALSLNLLEDTKTTWVLKVSVVYKGRDEQILILAFEGKNKLCWYNQILNQRRTLRNLKTEKHEPMLLLVILIQFLLILESHMPSPVNAGGLLPLCGPTLATAVTGRKYWFFYFVTLMGAQGWYWRLNAGGPKGNASLGSVFENCFCSVWWYYIANIFSGLRMKRYFLRKMNAFSKNEGRTGRAAYQAEYMISCLWSIQGGNAFTNYVTNIYWAPTLF